MAAEPTAATLANKLPGFEMPYGTKSIPNYKKYKFKHIGPRTNLACANSSIKDANSSGYNYNAGNRRCLVWKDVPKEDAETIDYEVQDGQEAFFRKENPENMKIIPGEAPETQPSAKTLSNKLPGFEMPYGTKSAPDYKTYDHKVLSPRSGVACANDSIKQGIKSSGYNYHSVSGTCVVWGEIPKEDTETREYHIQDGHDAFFRKEKPGTMKPISGPTAKTMANKLPGFDIPYGASQYPDLLTYLNYDQGIKTNIQCANKCIADERCSGYVHHNIYRTCRILLGVPKKDVKLVPFDQQEGHAAYFQKTNIGAMEYIKEPIPPPPVLNGNPIIVGMNLHLKYTASTKHEGPTGGKKAVRNSILYNHAKVYYEGQNFGMRYKHMFTPESPGNEDPLSMTLGDGNTLVVHKPYFGDGRRWGPQYQLIFEQDESDYSSVAKTANPVGTHQLIWERSIKISQGAHPLHIGGIILDITFREPVWLPARRFHDPPANNLGREVSGLSGTNGTKGGKTVTLYIGLGGLHTTSTTPGLLGDEWGSHVVVKREMVLKLLSGITTAAPIATHLTVATANQKPSTIYNARNARTNESHGCYGLSDPGMLGRVLPENVSASSRSAVDQPWGDWDLGGYNCGVANTPVTGPPPCEGPVVFAEWKDKRNGVLNCTYNTSDINAINAAKSKLEKSTNGKQNLYQQLTTAWCKKPGNLFRDYAPDKSCAGLVPNKLFEECSKDAVLKEPSNWNSCKLLLGEGSDATVKANFRNVVNKHCQKNKYSSICGCYNQNSPGLCQGQNDNRYINGCRELGDIADKYNIIIEDMRETAKKNKKEVSTSVITQLKNMINSVYNKPTCHSTSVCDNPKQYNYRADKDDPTCPPTSICIQNMTMGDLDAVASDIKVEQSCSAGTNEEETKASKADRDAMKADLAETKSLLESIKNGDRGETPAGGNTPDGKTPDGKTPDGKTPDGKTPDGKTKVVEDKDKPIHKRRLFWPGVAMVLLMLYILTKSRKSNKMNTPSKSNNSGSAAPPAYAQPPRFVYA